MPPTSGDRQRGIIIGSRTYGKGVAQSLFTAKEYPQAFADGSALLLTTGYAFSDSLTTANVMGVIPHPPGGRRHDRACGQAAVRL